MDALDRTAARLAVLGSRQQVLVGNVANAQTPGYKAREIDFASAFDTISKGEAPGGALVRTHAAHMGLDSEGGADVFEKKTALQPSADGSNVDLDEERAHLAQNALNIEAQMRFATHYLRLRQTAAS